MFGRPRKVFLYVLTAVSMLALLTLPSRAVAAPASSPANLWLTGHDLDFHCSYNHEQCNAMKVATDFVRNGSSLPLLILDECPSGCQVTAALTNAFGSLPSNTVLQPVAQAATWATLPLLNGDGSRKYSAIIVASDQSCGGCDNLPQDIVNINARKADIAKAVNKGTGVLALSGAHNFLTYYNFLPFAATGVAVAPPFQFNALGLSLGLTEGFGASSDDNCCATHNSFLLPATTSQYKVIETDSAKHAETLIAQGVGISGGGLTGGTALISVHAICTVPTIDPSILCGNPPKGCTTGGGPVCTQNINLHGICIKSAFSATSGSVNLGSDAGTFSITGVNSCSIRPFAVPVNPSTVGCILSHSYCDGASVQISGTGVLSGGLGNGPVQFALTIVDDDTGTASTDSNKVTLTLQTSSGPYVTGWHCSPPNGTEFADCGIEVTGRG